MFTLEDIIENALERLVLSILWDIAYIKMGRGIASWKLH